MTSAHLHLHVTNTYPHTSLLTHSLNFQLMELKIFDKTVTFKNVSKATPTKHRSNTDPRERGRECGNTTTATKGTCGAGGAGGSFVGAANRPGVEEALQDVDRLVHAVATTIQGASPALRSDGGATAASSTSNSCAASVNLPCALTLARRSVCIVTSTSTGTTYGQCQPIPLCR